MISCRDWWPWTEPGYITMTRRQSNNPMEWPHSDSPRPEKLQGKNPLENFSPGFFGIKTASSSLIIFQRSKLSTRSITHLCWCNWRTFWKKNAVGSSPSESCSCTAHRALATQKKLAYLGFQCLDHPTTCSLDWKKRLKARHFSSDAEVIVAAETWLDGQNSDFFLVACKSQSNGLRSVLSFVGSMLNKSWVWSL